MASNLARFTSNGFHTQSRILVNSNILRSFSNAPSAVVSGGTHKHKNHLIRFKGKRSREKVNVLGKSTAAPVPAPPQVLAKAPPSTTAPPKSSKKATGVDIFTLKGGAWYGRPKLSKEEMEAIDSGCAVL
jgi:hypothetical protein